MAWPHPFFIHHRTPDRSSTAPQRPALWCQNHLIYWHPTLLTYTVLSVMMATQYKANIANSWIPSLFWQWRLNIRKEIWPAKKTSLWQSSKDHHPLQWIIQYQDHKLNWSISCYMNWELNSSEYFKMKFIDSSYSLLMYETVLILICNSACVCMA